MRTKNLTPYIYISPFYVSFIVFAAFPILFSIVLSFHSWNGIREMEFNGLNNYIFLVKDPLFWKTIGNTIAMLLIGSIPCNIIAIVFAFILNQAFIKLKNTFKSILFLPYITSTVAIALIFGIFYGTRYGFLNYIFGGFFDFLNIIGLTSTNEPIEWLKGPLTLFSISFLSIWRWTGWNTLLYLAGMQSINPSIYEAAAIDGANLRQIFFKITLPLLKPIAFFTITMSIIGGMQAFDDPVVLLDIDGGPENAYIGFTTSMYIYSNAFRWGYFGVAAAASYILFLIIMIITWINKFIFRDKN